MKSMPIWNEEKKTKFSSFQLFDYKIQNLYWIQTLLYL